MSDAGTLERVALQLESVITSLIDRASGADAAYLLADLGLDVTPGDFTPAMNEAFRTIARAADALPELGSELESAIAAGETLEAVAKSAAIVAHVSATVDALVTLVDGMGSMNLPGLDTADLAGFLLDFTTRVLDQLIVEYIEGELPLVFALGSFVGLIESTLVNGPDNPGTGDFVTQHLRQRLRLDRVQLLFTNPEQLLEDLYGWGTEALAVDLFIERLAKVFDVLGLGVVPYRPAAGANLQLEILQFVLRKTQDPALVPPGIEAALMVGFGESAEHTIDIADGLALVLRLAGSLDASAAVQLLPPANIAIPEPDVAVQGSASMLLAKTPMGDDPHIVLLGIAGSSGLFAQRISAGLRTGFTWDVVGNAATGTFGIEGRIDGGRLVISGEGADGFIADLLSGVQIEADFDLGFGWTAGGGVFFDGSGGLQIRLPAHIDLGPIQLNGLTLTVGLDGATIPIGLGVDVGATLGPLAVTLERIGLSVAISFPADQKGNAGPVNFAFGFQPPAGAGLAIDAGAVRGGGYLFFDPDEGRYAGALELDIAGIVTVAALGLVTTKMPDGRPGTALLIIITAEFGSGIQLGYGFTLLGLGGLLGLNHTMALDALVEGVRTGSIDRVMFPRNIVQNAVQLINDLRSYFPVKRDTFLIGPMAKLGWGTPTLVSLSLAVIIEIPGNIAILGVLKVVLPDENAALLVLQVSFIGAIEFDKNRLWFFASLFGSRVLFMTIEGDMGLLVAWGDQPDFVISVGGFHPSFQPPPMPFPAPRRVAVSILDESWGRIRVEAYFAVTSNTVQFGAGVELFFGFSALSISGHLALDALFQFSPFYFIIGISGSLSLQVAGLSLLSVRLQLELEGPTPWRAKGTGSVQILFFEISASFDVTWGDAQDTSLPAMPVMPLLVAEFQKLDNWKAELPVASSLSVALRPLEDTTNLRLHPIGTLRVSQRAVPLDVRVDKVGNQTAADAHIFSIAPTLGSAFKVRDAVSEPFAIGQYQDLENSEKLSRKAFEPEHSGLELSGGDQGLTASRAVTRTLRYEEVVIDNFHLRFVARFVAVFAGLFGLFLTRNASAKAPVSMAQRSKLKPQKQAIVVQPDKFVVAHRADNRPLSRAAAAFTSRAQAQHFLAEHLAANPSLTGTLHVVEGFEIEEAA